MRGTLFGFIFKKNIDINIDTYICQTIRIRFSGFLKSLITREASILSYSQSWIEPK